MRANRAPLLLSCVVVLLLASVQGEEKHLSHRARALTAALTELQKKPDDPLLQRWYLSTFPHDYKNFLRLFDIDQELTDGHDFISILPSLSKEHDAEVGALLVGLSKDAHWEADATSWLQEATATYAGQHTATFVSLVEKLSSSDRASLITFLADVENHSSYKEYQQVIDNLRVLGQDKLAREFEAARRRRIRQPHD